MNERLLLLYIDTSEMGFYYGPGAPVGASPPSISAMELVRAEIQLCKGEPVFDEAGELTNPDTRFAGTLAASEIIVDDSFKWYYKGNLATPLTKGSAVSILAATSASTPRPIGAIRLTDADTVYYNGVTAAETGGYLFTLADEHFNAAPFTPAADFAAGASLRITEQPIIVSAQNDDSGRNTGRFASLLDAANPVYESMVEGKKQIAGTVYFEFNVYNGGRNVFRVRTVFICHGSLSGDSIAAWERPNVWTQSDSRYIKLSDWDLPDEFQFSADGVSWHDVQSGDDHYYHSRRPGATAWGQAIKMLQGPQGVGLPGPQGPHGEIVAVTVDVSDTLEVATVENLGTTTAARLHFVFPRSLFAQAASGHVHNNKPVLDALSDAADKLQYKGAPVCDGTGGGTTDPEDETRTVYYGYINDGELYQVSAITAAHLTAGTVEAMTAEVKTLVLNDVPHGGVMFALVPAGYAARKDNGLGGKVAFAEDTGSTAGTGANGTALSIGGESYRAYGEFILVTGNYTIYIEEA